MSLSAKGRYFCQYSVCFTYNLLPNNKTFHEA
jgi:hypothetical protein